MVVVQAWLGAYQEFLGSKPATTELFLSLPVVLNIAYLDEWIQTLIASAILGTILRS